MIIFICLFMAAPGLRWCALTFSSGGEWRVPFVTAHRLLIAWRLLLLRATGPRCAQASAAAACRLSSRGAQAPELRLAA